MKYIEFRNKMENSPRKITTSLLCHLETAGINIQITVNNETARLTQKLMAQLFGYSTDNISLHLKHVFNPAITSNGKNYKPMFYNLDVSREAIYGTHYLEEYS